MSGINKAIKEVNSLYAKGAIVNLAEHERETELIKTNRPSLDYLTDGGFPKGKLIRLTGGESAGKSSLTIQIANLMGNKILYVDTESTLTSSYIRQLGADVKKFSHCIPESTEQMCDIIRREIPNYDVIVIDSIDNTASNEQLQKSASERTMANRAGVLSSQLPIIIPRADQYGTTLFVISQLRDNMDKVNKYSPDTITTGGWSLKHNSSLTLELKAATKKKSKDSDEMNELSENVTGRMVKMVCSKNKNGIRDRVIEMEFTYGMGYTEEADIASSAVRLGILEKSGSWIKYKGTSIAQGIDNVVPVLFDNPELLEELRSEINNKILNGEGDEVVQEMIE